VVVATYQSVSGAGKKAMDELFSQTKAVYTAGEIESKKFPKRIAFNLIPQIDTFMEDGFTREEWKMVVETKRIVDPKIKLVATCVRVPVFIGHSVAGCPCASIRPGMRVRPTASRITTSASAVGAALAASVSSPRAKV
jgi:aspartate-semialdehyde dehydrogenase